MKQTKKVYSYIEEVGEPAPAKRSVKYKLEIASILKELSPSKGELERKFWNIWKFKIVEIGAEEIENFEKYELSCLEMKKIIYIFFLKKIKVINISIPGREQTRHVHKESLVHIGKVFIIHVRLGNVQNTIDAYLRATK